MNQEFDKIQTVFLEATAIAEPAVRQAYLDDACKSDAELRRQVEALLFSHENAGEFLNRSVVRPPAESLTEAPGMVVGKYKLLQEIGEGGFGVVFMAEQLEPVRRKVALKVIKPGMDTREVIARLEAERQALALMDHPNVARVLDGGTTASGRPYFVMDLVKGTPITDFCDQQQLPPRDRLALFLQICAGVQHAHQKGIIHRDLKPTNVLVTVQDGQPIVKVIDFGIAKAIGHKLTQKTLFTRFEQLLGTPAYMSPEQAQWSSTDVDTRSDVYSLGVLLYELLTGTTPFEKETLAGAALDEVRRTIREVEPPAPSTRLQALGPRVAQVAQHRQTEPTQLARLVKGELDWIVMRALDKDRGRRYETANGLSQDIQRYLQDEPVTAGPPSRIYLVRKFVRRHQAAVGASVGIATTLFLGLGVALFGLNKARFESAQAKSQAESADALSSFLREEILLQARPYFNPTNRNITLREVLDLAAPKIDGRFKHQPLVAAGLHFNVGSTYYGLGEMEKAEEHVRRAVTLRLANRQHLSSLDRLQPQQILGELLLHKGDNSGEVQRILEQVAKESSIELGTNHWFTLLTQRTLADAYVDTVQRCRAEQLYRSILKAQICNSGKDSEDALATANSLARLHFSQARFFESAAELEEIIAIQRKKDAAPKNATTAVNLWNLGSSFFCLGEYEKAAGAFRECVSIANLVLGVNHPETAFYKASLMKAEGCLGHWQECVELGSQMTKATGDEVNGAIYAAALCSLAISNAAVYRELVARLNELAATSTNVLPTLAEALCVASQPLYDSAQAERVADRAQAIGDQEYTCISKGIVEYRRGNFRAALKYLEPRAREHDLLAAQAAFFVAMAHWQLGNTNAVNQALALASQKLGPALNRGYLWEDWHELPRAILAKREAEALIPHAPRLPEPDEAALAHARERWHPLKVHIDKGTELGAQGRCSEARDEFLAAARSPLFELNDLLAYDYEVPARIAAATLAAKDESSYQELRTKWLTWCKTSDDIPGDLIEACFVPRTSNAAPDAELLVRTFPYKPKEFNSYLATLLLAFRVGNFDRVLELRAPDPSEDVSIRNRYVKRVTAKVFRAMALAKTSHLEEGAGLLRELDNTLAPYLEHYDGDFWWDIVFCKTALDEAHTMLSDMASVR